jgi:hypothetical protein
MNDPVLSAWRVDRTALSVAKLTDQPDDDDAYWFSRTPQERLAALELMRRITYGPAASGRLQRILEVIDLPGYFTSPSNAADAALIVNKL